MNICDLADGSIQQHGYYYGPPGLLKTYQTSTAN